MADDARLLDLDEVARRLDVSARTVKRLIFNGDIRSVLVSRRCRRVAVADLEDYIATLRAERGYDDDDRWLRVAKAP